MGCSTPAGTTNPEAAINQDHRPFGGSVWRRTGPAGRQKGLTAERLAPAEEWSAVQAAGGCEGPHLKDD